MCLCNIYFDNKNCLTFFTIRTLSALLSVPVTDVSDCDYSDYDYVFKFAK